MAWISASRSNTSAKSLAAALIPAGLLAGVLGALGYAYFDAQKQAREFNVAINGGSNDAGQRVQRLADADRRHRGER